jgi:hypothetical protein
MSVARQGLAPCLFADRSVRATLAEAALGGTGGDARLSTTNEKKPRSRERGFGFAAKGEGARATVSSNSLVSAALP